MGQALRLHARHLRFRRAHPRQRLSERGIMRKRAVDQPVELRIAEALPTIRSRLARGDAEADGS